MWHSPETPHAQALGAELDWLTQVLERRLAQHFNNEVMALDVEAPRLPEGSALAAVHAELAAAQGEAMLSVEERLLLALALAPHLRPEALDLLFMRNQNLDRGYTELGGLGPRAHGGFRPTGETAAFLLAGGALARRLALVALLGPAHAFASRGVLQLAEPASGEPRLNGPLGISPQVLQRLCTGHQRKPDRDAQFPATLISSPLRWNDLVLAPEVLQEVGSLTAWLKHGSVLMNDWGLARRLKPGYRALFRGPPGTGKTLTAALIGQQAGVDVYRVDVPGVLSRTLADTERQLGHVFDQAASRNWLLVLDEADALMGHGHDASHADGRTLNPAIASLWRRVEDFPGVVVLVSRLGGQMADTVAHRLQSVVHFPMPDAQQRLRLWRGMLAEHRLAPDVRLDDLAQRHELSGGAMANVIRHAALSALSQGRAQVSDLDLRQGVARELRQQGKTA